MKQIYVLIVLILLMLYLNTCNQTNDTKHSVDGYDLYGYDACPYTLKMKAELERKNLRFTYKQIDKNENYRREYESFGIKGVPFVVNRTSGENFVGFRSM